MSIKDNYDYLDKMIEKKLEILQNAEVCNDDGHQFYFEIYFDNIGEKSSIHHFTFQTPTIKGRRLKCDLATVTL